MSCAQTTGACPTECPMGGNGGGGDENGGDDAVTEPSSIVAPGCGTIVEVECPGIATTI